MATRNFEVKNFYKLLDYKFVVPFYQRGYRWERQQVEDLLNDFVEFIKNSNSDFYCLQPIVVRRTFYKNEYEVIDGQQRLITIYLIMKYLQDTRNENCNNYKMYSIKFARNTKDYLSEELLKEPDYNNIDSFYISQAYKCIENWFEINKEQKDNIARILTGEFDNNDCSDDEKKDVRVIWYELNDGNNFEFTDKQMPSRRHDDKPNGNKFEFTDTQKQVILTMVKGTYLKYEPDFVLDAIDTFTRLNEGKIPLTESDLIKALLLQTDLYSQDNKQVMKEIAFNRSCGWDEMEKELQNPLFWSMLTPSTYSPASHIDIVTYLVSCKLKQKDEENYKEFSENKPLFSYLVINKFINGTTNNSNDENKKIENIKKIWTEIRKTFIVLSNWFNDKQMYHLVGLLNLINDKEDKKTFFAQLLELYNYSLENNKSELRQHIKEKISKKLITGKDDNNEPYTLETINYNSCKDNVIRVLEAFNVYLSMEDKHESRFDFDKFKHYNVTSVEHIHPQYLDMYNLSFEQVKSWFNGHKEANIDKEDFKEACENLQQIIEQIDKEKNKEIEFKKLFGNNSEISNYIKIIDEEFNELAGMNEDIMHSIQNLALVDKDTNTSISNNILYKKRELLYSREQNNQTYVPIGTYAAFNKRFSKEIKDLSFWTNDDRKAYFEKIAEAYNYFTNPKEEKE